MTAAVIPVYSDRRHVCSRGKVIMNYFTLWKCCFMEAGNFGLHFNLSFTCNRLLGFPE